MRSFLTLCLLLLGSLAARAVTTSPAWSAEVAKQSELSILAAEIPGMNAEQFLDLTPNRVQELTGKRLGIKGTFALKAAQKAVKKQLANGGRAEDFPKGGYIVLAIFSLGWIAMGVMDDWGGNNWWVNLLLSICWLPGLIHAFVKMKDYY